MNYLSSVLVITIYPTSSPTTRPPAQVTVVQFHLAGHTNCGTHCIDTHDGHVVDPVWKLYQLAHELTGGVSTLLEWDASIPEFSVVHNEVLKAKTLIACEGDDLPEDWTPEPDVVATKGAVPHPAVFAGAEAE